MKKLLHEPLVHFLLLGLLVFIGFKFFSRNETSEAGTIIVTQAQIQSLVTGFTRTWQRPPTTPELEGLIREYIREEICTREAIALGLDRDDTVIRRRLRQKLEFLSDSVASQAEPTDEQLQNYLEAHADTYRSEQRFTFTQIFLDPQKRGENLTRDVDQMLAQLRLAAYKPDVWQLGDSLLLELNYEAVSGSEVSKQFGEEFAAKLVDLPVGQWSGPLASGYGVHLVLLADREQGAAPQLRDVREAVKRDWVNYQRSETNEKFYQALLKRYTVTVEYPRLAFLEKDPR
ncbi:MAG TPA: peptidylprolyl isomerase [Pyrinomonadaceae bacterium]|nr:peptidylprolyl isomerase [Pyrinomonadaceae bacterium]